MTFPKRNGTELRRAELAQIHVAKKQLCLDDETYGQVLWTVGRVKSSADLDWTGRKKLLEHFKARGWKPAPPKSAKASKPVGIGQEGLIRSLWTELHEAEKVRDPSDAALGAWLVRNKWPEQVAWLNAHQTTQAIEALKKWLER